MKRHIGKVQVSQDFITAVLGFPGATSTHMWYSPKAQCWVFAIEHPLMPEGEYPHEGLLDFNKAPLVVVEMDTDHNVTVTKVEEGSP